MPDFQPQPQDLVMTVLGAHLPVRDRLVWSGGLVQLLREFGFSTAAARAALARLVGRGLLERERAGRLIHYRVTPRCAALLEEGDRRIFSLGREPSGGEQWTLLWHAIPDDRRQQRGRLARRLRFLGFGPVQDGIWIAPHDHAAELAGLIKDLGVSGYTGILVGRPAGPIDISAVAARAWDLGGLAERYREFVGEFAGYARRSGKRRLDDSEAFTARTRLAHRFRDFASLDPELPGDVEPRSSERGQAVALFHQLYAALRPAAQRHFDEVTTP